jgi:hypothetical protein
MGEFKQDWLKMHETQNCTEWGLHGLGVAGVPYSEPAPFVERPTLYTEPNSLHPIIEKTYKCIVKDGVKYAVGIIITLYLNKTLLRGNTSHALVYTGNNTRRLVDLRKAEIPLDRLYPDAFHRHCPSMQETEPNQ